MPRASFKKLKDRAKARGQRGAADDLDQQARAAGLAGGMRDVFAAIARVGAQPAPQPAPAAPAPPEETAMARRLDDKERARRKQVKQNAAAQVALKEQEIATLKARLAARDASAAEEVATADMRARLGSLGMADAAYGVHIVREQLVGKTPAQVKEFIEGAGLKTWVEGQKQARPALFAPVVQPANTAPGAANGVSAPGTPPVGTPPIPGTPPPPDVQGSRIALNMSRPRAEVEAEKFRLKQESRRANNGGQQ
jgi:hypothetical protein